MRIYQIPLTDEAYKLLEEESDRVGGRMKGALASEAIVNLLGDPEYHWRKFREETTEGLNRIESMYKRTMKEEKKTEEPKDYLHKKRGPE